MRLAIARRGIGQLAAFDGTCIAVVEHPEWAHPCLYPCENDANAGGSSPQPAPRPALASHVITFILRRIPALRGLIHIDTVALPLVMHVTKLEMLDLALAPLDATNTHGSCAAGKGVRNFGVPADCSGRANNKMGSRGGNPVIGGRPVRILRRYMNDRSGGKRLIKS